LTRLRLPCTKGLGRGRGREGKGAGRVKGFGGAEYGN
jgi:hypothetical protein